jgi:hypothetical protein
MSTRVSQPEKAPQTEARPANSQFEKYVEQQLESTRQQVKLTELTAGLLTLGLWMLGLLLLGILLDSWVLQFGPVARLIAFALLIGGGLWIGWSKIAVLFLRRIHRLYAARMIESGSENFHNSLVNYLQVKDGGQVDREAIVQAISQRAARDLSQISPTEKVDRTRAIQLGFGLVGLVGALVAYTLLSPKSPWPSIARILNPVSSISAPTIVQVTKVAPGDTDVFFGQKLLVTAEIRGRHSPDEVRLVYSTKDGQHVEVPAQMLPTGSGGSYQLELSTTPSGIDSPLSYYVTANDGRSPSYSVNVKPNPAIAIQQIEITPPAYTRLPPRTLTGQTEIDGLEGSKVKLTAVANMPIQVAWVELLRQRTRGRETSYEVVRTVELRTDETLQANGEFTLSLDANRSTQIYSHYQLLFRTADGQRNPLVNIQPLRITPDLPPVVKVVRPFDREVAVPLNRSLELELQAEDPDFEISRLQLLLDHQGGLLLDEEIELSDNRKQQRITATYRFEPRKLRLSVGDEILFHGRASDNRVAALSGQLDPNVARTENYKIRITEPLETEIAETEPENTGAGQAAPNAVAQGKEGDSQNTEQTGESTAQPADNQQANNQAGGTQQAPSESAGNQDAQAQMSESQTGDGNATQNQNPAQAENKTPDQSPQAQGDSQSESSQQSNQQAEQTEPPSAQEQPQNPEQKSGSEAGQKASGSEPGQKASGSEPGQKASGGGGDGNQSETKESGKSESGNQGEPSGDAQANPQAAEKQTGDNQSGQPSEKQAPPAGSESSGKSNQEKSNPTANPNEPKPDNPLNQGGNQKAMSQPADSSPQTPEASKPNSQSQGNQSQGNQSQGNQSQGNQSQGNQSQGNQSQGNQSAGQQSAGQQSAGAQSSNNQSAGDQSTGKSGSESSDTPAGQEGESGESPKSGGGTEEGAENSSSSGQESPSGQSGSERGSESDSEPSAAEPLDKSATDAERFRRLQERLERQRSSAESSKSEDTAPESEQSSTGSSTQPSGENSKQPQKDPGSQPERGAENQPQPADRQNNTGDAQPPQQPNQPSQPNQSNRPQAQQPQGQGSGDQQSEKQSGQNSQQSGSGQPGEQSGDQPGEQSGEKSGESGSGSKSGGSSEQSGGQSGGQSGQQGEPGENSKSGGSGGQDSKSGRTSSQSGQGSSASGQPGGQPNATSGSSGNSAGADNAQGSDAEISQRKDQPQDRRSSAGQANTSSAGTGSNESPPVENEGPAGAAEGNLEYSEKATDLVLDHLRNQSNKPDPELLREMNWTEQDLQDFLTRWEAMKQKANTGTPQEKKRYADALRSLGLRPEEVRRNVLQSRRDQLNKLSEDGAVNRPPANLAEPFNAFLKNRNRVQKDK